MAELYRDQDVYRRIESVLETRRVNARRALDEKRTRAFAQCPELENIEYELSRIGVSYNRKLLDGDLTVGGAQAGIAEDGAALNDRRAELFGSLGLPTDYFALAPECPLCADTGYVTGARGLPERCSCFRQMLLDSLADASNLPAAGDASFERFDETLFSDRADEKKYGQPVSPRENIKRIRDSAQRFVRAFKDGPAENLYFFGQSGTGKTFMAAAIANALTDMGVTVLYQSAPALFNIITEYRMRAVRDEDYRDTVYRRILDAELLIIDDLGTESMTNARYSEFVTLLNERLAGGGAVKRTIISTNMELAALRRLYDERIFSRIVGTFKIIYFFGDDLRLNRPKIP
ncbi:MAG: ATP-binding protein [Clostridiales bacterium]|jgi:DNA replication protein DnaC|nr:ATP-binding protein [Clostridiales bacterium]